MIKDIMTKGSDLQPAIILSRGDLSKMAVNKPIEDIIIFDFPVSREMFNKAHSIVFIDGVESKVLKNRYPGTKLNLRKV